MSLSKSDLKQLIERYHERTRAINKATISSIIQETPEAQQERIKYLLKPENYNEFFGYYFGKDTPQPLADSDCSWYHVDVYNDLYKKAFLTLFNLIHRGGAKSTHANLGYIFGLKQSELAKFFLVVGANETRSAMLLQDLQVQFEANNRIIKDFGTQKAYGSWADGQFETNDKCTFMALGIDQPFRGLRANGVRVEYASIDDVEDMKRTLNKQLIREYADKITGDIQGAFSINSERMIINNNYFVEGGIIGTLAKRKGFDLRKMDTKHRIVKKEKHAHLYLVNLTDLHYKDIQANPEVDFKPEWPRFSREYCLRKIDQYKHDEASLSNEYYNTPIKAGKRIKDTMIKMVKPRAIKDYILILGNWDFAYTDTACYRALATVGVHATGMTVIDLFCRQVDMKPALDYHFARGKAIIKVNPSTVFYYDGAVAQEAVHGPVILREAVHTKDFAVIPMPQKSGTDKHNKIDTVLVSALTSGALDFSEELEKNPDWEEAKAQMLNFEKGGKYPIDFPDALTDAIIQITANYGGLEQEDELQKPVFGKRKPKGY